jgi:hypothetical protein
LYLCIFFILCLFGQPLGLPHILGDGVVFGLADVTRVQKERKRRAEGVSFIHQPTENIMSSDSFHSPVETCNDALGRRLLSATCLSVVPFLDPPLSPHMVFLILLFEKLFWKQRKIEGEGNADKVENLYWSHDRLRDRTICCGVRHKQKRAYSCPSRFKIVRSMCRCLRHYALPLPSILAKHN